jgi:hypothetical protein
VISDFQPPVSGAAVEQGVLTASEIDADPTVFMRTRKPVDEAEIGRRLVGKAARRVTRIRELRRWNWLTEALS